MKLATSVVSLLILIAVLLPGSNIPDVGIGGVDKIVHIGMFVTWVIAVRFDFNRSSFPVLPVGGIGIAFSMLTEVLQIMVEGRTFDVYDVAADILGIAIGLAISGPIVRWVDRFR